MRRLVPLLLLAGACSKKEPPPRVEVPIPLDTLCAEVARADCNRLNECGALEPPFDPQLCQLRQEQVLCAPIAAALEAAVDDGALTYFELAARDCRDEVGGLDCSVGLQHDLLEIDACRGMVSGGGEDGAPCAIGLACADGFHCVAENGCPGRCRAYRQNNETCGIGQPCAQDLFCSVTAMRCHARVDLNGTCELTLDNNPCRDGGSCDGSNPAQMTCVSVKGRGQGCNSSFECLVGARCIANRCSAGEDGDVCVDAADCRGDLFCFGGKCVAGLAGEEPCREDTRPCAEGLACTSSVGIMACHPRPIAGAPCDPGGCYLSHCAGGRCAASVFPEEACTGTAECFPGHTCEDSVCKVEPIACTE